MEYLKAFINNSLSSMNTSNQTFTENGEVAYKKTLNKSLDFFSLINRETAEDTVLKLFVDAYNEDPVVALKIVFNSRDVHNGKGNRLVSNICMLLLAIENRDVYLEIIRDYVVNYGYWKDLLTIIDVLNRASICVDYEVSLFADQLKIDNEKSNGTAVETAIQTSISLCAKWAPSEGLKYDHIATMIMNKMGMTPRNYRKMLTKLRQKLNVLEQNMSTHHYDKINFEQVPSRAMMLYSKAFNRETNADGETDQARQDLVDRYHTFIEGLKNKVAKINFKGVQVHELVSKIIGNNSENDIQVYESMWNNLVDTVKSKGTFKNSLAISDVSGSMNGTPMFVSIGLGLLVSQCCEGYYSGKLMTFSQNPVLHTVSGATLHDKMVDISKMNWNMNTNIQRVFEIILDNYTKGLAPVPEKIFIFTDMQFDQVTSEGASTFSKFKTLYNNNGVALPQIVCWNLGSNAKCTPIKHDDKGVAMLSGYSHTLLETVMYTDDLNPMAVMMNALNRYNFTFDLNLIKTINYKLIEY